MPVPAGTAVLAAVSGVDRESAREAAAEELARRVYRESGPSLADRALLWLWERLLDLLRAAESVGLAGRTGLLVLLLLLVAVAVVVRSRLGPVARRSAASASAGGRGETAADARRAADAHAAAGRHTEAVRARMRALVRALADRGLLVPRVGLTAAEAAAEAGARAPVLADDVAEAARLFAEVVYGGRPATPELDRRMRELDERVRAARTTPAAHAPAPTPAGVAS